MVGYSAKKEMYNVTVWSSGMKLTVCVDVLVTCYVIWSSVLLVLFSFYYFSKLFCISTKFVNRMRPNSVYITVQSCIESHHISCIHFIKVLCQKDLYILLKSPSNVSVYLKIDFIMAE